MALCTVNVAVEFVEVKLVHILRKHKLIIKIALVFVGGDDLFTIITV